jgi:hypothetical protein
MRRLPDVEGEPAGEGLPLSVVLHDKETLLQD